jgi:hypothetical protein
MNNQDQEIVCHSKQQLRILNKFRKRLEKEKYINNYTSNYYGNMHNRFSIPGIIVSGVSSIASFLATSDMMSNTAKTAISISVGILAACSTVIYSVANSYGFQSRRDSFQISADAYDDLITRIEFELVNPNEDFNEFCNSLESQILKIKTDCKYLPPLFIYKMYEEESRKLKQSGLEEEREVSLDFVMVDNSPARAGGVPATSSFNTNKQIKLPSTTNVVGQQPDVQPMTYFNDLAASVGPTTCQSITTVNKLAAGVFANQVTPINISNLNFEMSTSEQEADILEQHLFTQQQLANQGATQTVSINLTNIDGDEIDDASSV